MNDDALRSAYARLLEERSGSDATCVSPESLVAIADGTAPEPERLRVLAHVGRCARCQADLDLLRATHEAATAAAPAPWHHRPWMRAAAGIVLVVGAFSVWRISQPADVPRGSGPAPAAIELLEPRDNAAVALPATLVWSAAAGARSYEIEVLRADGSVAFQATTADTTFVLAPDAALTPGGSYRWWVRTVLADGARATPARRLRIVP